MALSFEYLSQLLRLPVHLLNLQDVIIDDYENTERFPWIGPHLLPFLDYAVKLPSNKHSRIRSLLQLLDDSARTCIFYAQNEDYREFVKMVAEVIPKVGDFFVVPDLQTLSDSNLERNQLLASFINFLLETLRELQEFAMGSSFLDLLVSDQITVLSKELKFLRTFLGDTPLQSSDSQENKNILTEIEAVANEAGNFLYSFFFRTDQNPMSEVDLALKVLLQRIETAKAKIKEYFIKVLKQPSSPAPKTAVISLFIVDSLLHDLDFLINNKADLILDLYDQITTLREELMFSRSILNDMEVQKHSEIKELIECVIQLRDIAYEADYIISSFVVGEARVSYTDRRISDFIKRNKLIRTAFPKIKLNYEIESLGEVSNQTKNSPGEVSNQTKNIPIVDEIVVGFKDEMIHIADQLTRGPNYRQVISIVGMPGIGKTTLAKKLYNSPYAHPYFDKCSWCVVSQTYQRRKLLIDILSSVSDLDRDTILNMEDECLAEYLYKSLKGRRYLIVMDDVWNTKAWDDFERYFPNDKNGSTILLTSRLKDVALQISSDGIINELPFLSRDECWNLLQKKVFPKEDCPSELLEIGRQIATNCQGLPLAVVVIAAVLANMEKKESLWQKVAANLSSYISEDPCKDILELSYKNLPIHLKPCFLYFAAFKEDEEIPVKKLLSLWVAEGFIQKNEQKSLEDIAEEYLIDLINRSLIQVAKKRSDNGVKTCTIHDLLRDMCLRMAKEENFLKVIKHQFSMYEQHHRLCIQSYSCHSQSKPFGLHIRSLLGCFSDPFICPSLKLLKILELSSGSAVVRGIEDLVHLRYLAISWIPSSIGRLKNLEFLLAKTADDIPKVLLNMPKLRHLHVEVPVKFNDSCDSSQMNNLETLSFVHIFHVKDEEILRCSPNLRTLKCICEQFLVDSRTYRYPNLESLTQLQSLKMEFLSGLKGEINIPTNIKKLTLCKSSLPWEKMSIIGTLPNLEILKIVSDAFVGSRWNTRDDEFQKLKFFKLDSVKLIEWNASSDHFPRLERLVLQRCYHLRKIPSELGYITTLQMIEARSCGLYIRESAMQIQEEQEENGRQELKVIISGSYW